MENDISKFFDNLAPTWNDGEVHSPAEITAFITKYVPLKEGMKVLDIGCGTGIISNTIYGATKTKVAAIDVSPAMIDIARKTHDENHIDYSVNDFYTFQKSGYDALICFNAYPHFLDTSAFVKKAYEVLNDKGICAIIHNMSHEKLAQHHASLTANLSRVLLNANLEADAFRDCFTPLNIIDNDEMILMLFEKI